MSTLVLAEEQSEILASLRRLKGRATAGDVIADSGLPGDAVRSGLKALLESHRGHLAVADSGELVYEFERGMIERGTEPFLARAKRTVGRVVRGGFKAWIVIMLVVYFAVMVALVIAAVLASQRGNDSRGGWGGGRGGRRGGGGLFHFDPLLLYWIWGPRWRIGRPYYGHRWERTLDKEDRVPFYKKVFAFVFGPDRPEPTNKQLDRGKLRLIRARNGVITTAELVEHTGSTFDAAEDEMARLLGTYDGEAAVSPDGELVYAFPGLMASVTEKGSVKPPNPTWRRLEPKQELTGNTPGANAIVVGMNAFTLTAAATAPWFIFPRLGLGGPAAFFGLVVVPIVFSTLFFAGPLLRMVGVGFENRRRARRNVRRVLLGLVYERALKGRGLSVDEASAFVSDRLSDQSITRDRDIEPVLQALATEVNADVSVSDAGEVTYRFDSIRQQFEASEIVRGHLRLGDRSIGEIVFSTSDSSESESERELSLFDRELLGGDVELGSYLPNVDRVDFEEEYELIAFDEELKRRGLGRP